MDSKPLCILVTGSSGFIGRHLVKHLAAAGHRVIGFDLLPPEDQFPEGCIFLCGDIRNARLPNEGIDAVVHLAALAGVRPFIDGPFDYHSTDLTGTPRPLGKISSTSSSHEMRSYHHLLRVGPSWKNTHEPADLASVCPEVS